MLKVFVASDDIADISEEIELSEYRKNKIAALNNDEVKKQSKAVGMLFSYALRFCYGIDESRVEYGESERGKPFLKGYPDVYFNISHTKGRCAVALSDKPVGIDIERFRDFFDGHSFVTIAKRYFSEAERVAYGLMSNGEGRPGMRRFYRLWTAKESAVKCTGDGIADGFKGFSLPFFTTRCEFEGRYFTAIDTEEYALTVCSCSDEMPIVEKIECFEDMMK